MHIESRIKEICISNDYNGAVFVADHNEYLDPAFVSLYDVKYGKIVEAQ